MANRMVQSRLPLDGIKVLEFAGLAPGPLCGKILSDFGASIIRVDKEGTFNNYLDDHKRSLCLNLKKPDGLAVAKKLCKMHDVIIDPFRPGVLERLGLGPTEIMKDNPAVIYARLSGYGQTGPMSLVAGHDINYVSLSGVLSMLGRKDAPPTPPINLLADFAGGGVLCALGVAFALFERTKTGVGKVVDCSMAEGTSYISSFLYSSKSLPIWGEKRGENVLDTGAHFYDTYRTKDDKYMAVGAIEPQFYRKFLEGLDFSVEEIDHMSNFEENKKVIADRFLQKTRKEWSQIFDGTDACVSPVLTLEESGAHPHNVHRRNYRKVRDLLEPVAAPKLLDREGKVSDAFIERMADGAPCPIIGQHSVEVLTEFGFKEAEIKPMLENGAVIQENLKSNL